MANLKTWQGVRGLRGLALCYSAKKKMLKAISILAIILIVGCAKSFHSFKNEFDKENNSLYEIELKHSLLNFNGYSDSSIAMAFPSRNIFQGKDDYKIFAIPIAGQSGENLNEIHWQFFISDLEDDVWYSLRLNYEMPSIFNKIDPPLVKDDQIQTAIFTFKFNNIEKIDVEDWKRIEKKLRDKYKAE